MGIKIWLIDFSLFMKYNGTIHQRTACLFERADEWERKHSNYKLLVVLDHISHYYQNKETPDDRGIVWNELESLFHWKKYKKWTLFVVESNPNMMMVEGMDYAQKIFYENSRAHTICIPFVGGTFFKKVMTRLISTNHNVIRLHFKSNENAEWEQLLEYMQFYTLADTFFIYYTRIRNDAHSLYQKHGIPISLQFENISSMIQEYNNHFQDTDIQKMKEFALSIGEKKCFKLDDSITSKPSLSNKVSLKNS